MPLISMDNVREAIKVTIPRTKPYSLSQTQKIENIDRFNALDRNGLVYGVTEKRILLYNTQYGEKLYMQYPGKESTRERGRFPLDARPVLKKADGTFAPDMDFKRIWDIIDVIGTDHRGDMDILAALFLRIAYMLGYQNNNSPYECETIDIATNSVVDSQSINFVWNSLSLSPDVIETLNDRFGSFNGISLEAFLYYNDLLAQNEDCKYHYLHNDSWNICTGRINNCLSHLTVISHLRGNMGISELIDRFQRTGVAPLPQSRFSDACGDLVTRE